MKSSIIKRSVIIRGHKTSISLEDEFWNALRDIAKEGHGSLSCLLSSLDADRQNGNLSSAVRLFVLNYYKQRLAPTRSALETFDLVHLQ